MHDGYQQVLVTQRYEQNSHEPTPLAIKARYNRFEPSFTNCTSNENIHYTKSCLYYFETKTG